MIIAIDGPAASGKGTLAKRLAAHYRLPHLDTGLLYRAVARALLDDGRALTEVEAATIVARELDLERFDDERLRGREMGDAASVVSAFQPVRDALLDLQRRFAAQPGGAVLDGRDIGTVIAPQARAKLFVTATPQVRAERRWKQLNGQGETVSLDEVLADIRRRDERDSSRSAAPLIQALDASLLDTSEMTIDDAFCEACRLVEQALDR
jgi:cytidylate kinase